MLSVEKQVRVRTGVVQHFWTSQNTCFTSVWFGLVGLVCFVGFFLVWLVLVYFDEVWFVHFGMVWFWLDLVCSFFI